MNCGDVDNILDIFPIVERRDETCFKGDYRTKRVLLEIYDALADQRFVRSGV